MGEIGKIGESEIFSCKSCNKESKVFARYQIRFVVCPFCGAGFSRVDGLFMHQRSNLSIHDEIRTYLSLHDEAIINGARYILTGIIVRKEASAPYTWREFYLFNPAKGYLVLSEYDGHWILLEQLKIFPHDPKKALSLLFDRKAYKLYNSYKTKLVSAVGEFCFDILEDTPPRIMEYISPPFMISSERSSSEMSWYAGKHLEPSEVKSLFGKEDPPPKRIGIGAVQVQKSWIDIDMLKTLSVGFILLMIMTQIFMLLTSSEAVVFEKDVYMENLETYSSSDVQYFDGHNSSSSSGTVLTDSMMKAASTPVPKNLFVSETFELLSGSTNIEIATKADVSNSWLELEIALVNESNGKVYNIDNVIEYYQGYDGGESWSEGSRDDNTLLSNLEAGKYHLEISNYRGVINPPSTYSVKVTKGVQMWSNFFLILMLGLVIPGIIYWRNTQFEAQRWENSNYG